MSTTPRRPTGRRRCWRRCVPWMPRAWTSSWTCTETSWCRSTSLPEWKDFQIGGRGCRRSKEPSRLLTPGVPQETCKPNIRTPPTNPDSPTSLSAVIKLLIVSTVSASLWSSPSRIVRQTPILRGAGRLIEHGISVHLFSRPLRTCCRCYGATMGQVKNPFGRTSRQKTLIKGRWKEKEAARSK